MRERVTRGRASERSGEGSGDADVKAMRPAIERTVLMLCCVDARVVAS